MLVSKAKYDALVHEHEQNIAILENELNNKDELIKAQKSDLKNLDAKLKKAENEVSQLQMQNKSMEGLLYGGEQSEESKVEIKFKDDLTGMFPVTKINKDSVKYLVDHKYLPYNRQEESESQSLALILYASDALNSFIAEFEEEPADVETKDAH